MDAWRAGAAVLGQAAPAILSDLGISGGDVTFLPALAHGETVASDKGVLGILAKWCASRCGSEFVLELLNKRAHPSLSTQRMNLAQRQSTLADAEYRAGAVSTPNVFVLDDFVTTGSTLSRIASTIKDANSGVSVYCIAIGKNERRSWNPSISNDHIPVEWDQVWREYDKA